MKRRNVLAGLAATAGLAAFGRPAAATYDGGDLIGRLATYKVQAHDTLLDVAQAFGLGFVELRAANPGIDAWVPQPGAVLLLPTAHLLPEAPRRGLVINLGEQRLYVYGRERGVVETYPIGIGRDGMTTPLGETRIARKQQKPTWYPTPDTREDRPELPAAVPPGPDNPLGEYALYLGWPRYLVHGTNQPDGVGRRVSRGCIRMYPPDIERLYRMLPVGTPVSVVDQAVKLGWWDGQLYLQVHPTHAQMDEIEEDGLIRTPEPVADLDDRLARVAGEDIWRVDLTLARQIAADRYGIPVRITR